MLVCGTVLYILKRFIAPRTAPPSCGVSLYGGGWPTILSKRHVLAANFLILYEISIKISQINGKIIYFV